MERTPNQHAKLTLKKKILPPLLPGFELATFRSRVRRSNQQAISAPLYATSWWLPRNPYGKIWLLLGCYHPVNHIRSPQDESMVKGGQENKTYLISKDTGLVQSSSGGQEPNQMVVPEDRLRGPTDRGREGGREITALNPLTAKRL